MVKSNLAARFSSIMAERTSKLVFESPNYKNYVLARSFAYTGVCLQIVRANFAAVHLGRVVFLMDYLGLASPELSEYTLRLLWSLP